jgi:diguanylate cyclase (GGDEF)-like protein
MNPLKLFSTPPFYSTDDLHAYRKAQLLNFWLLFGFLMLVRSTARNFIYQDNLIDLVIGVSWCTVIALAYYQFKIKHRIYFPAWIGSLSVAWIIGSLAYHSPTLAAPLLLLVPLVSFSLIGIVWGAILSVSFSIFIIVNLILNPGEIGSLTPNAFLYNHMMALILGGGAACYLELGKQKVIDELHDSASRDELTKCWNRNAFLQCLNSEIKKATHLQTDFALVIIDIDNFKNINDTYGHNAGDDVLKEIVNVITTCIRRSDTFARWGGDEFVMLLPGANDHDANSMCEEISKKITTLHFLFSDAITTSVSMGLTTNQANISPKDLMQRADRALYEAKRQGRDCIRIWDQTLEMD